VQNFGTFFCPQPAPRCDACSQDFLIAFSCKDRAACPTCNTRRTVETAAHLADHVQPRVSVRQVRCYPYPNGYAITSRTTAKRSKVPYARIFLDALKQFLRGNLGASTRTRTGCAAFPLTCPRYGTEMQIIAFILPYPLPDRFRAHTLPPRRRRGTCQDLTGLGDSGILRPMWLDCLSFEQLVFHDNKDDNSC
jgi:hypothetical protein